MRKVSLKSLDEVSVEGDLVYKGQVRPKEQAKVITNIQDIQLSYSAKDTQTEVKGPAVEKLESGYFNHDTDDVHQLGQATSTLDAAIEIALSLMVDGETAALDITLPWRYITLNGDLGKDYDNILTVSLSCVVHLKVVQFGRLVYEFTLQEKLSIAVEYKNLGVQLYKEGTPAKQTCAFLKFRDAIKWLAMIGQEEAKEMFGDIQNTKTQCYNNIALHHIQQEHYILAVSATSTVLGVEDQNVKALYRRAVANTGLQNYETALSDVMAALVLDPKNRRVKQQEEIIKKKQSAISGKYAAAMKKYFD